LSATHFCVFGTSYLPRHAIVQ